MSGYNQNAPHGGRPDGKSDLGWEEGTVRRMLSNPDATERVIEESVWKQINQLPDAQRDELLKCVAEGNGHKHPLFVRIFQSVRAELHGNKPK